MRELKFRAWGKDTKKFLYIELGPNARIRDNIWRCYSSHDDWEQYTGLKDKNGKEIYEGDIVRVEGYSRDYQVVYRQWDCSFMFENDEDEEIVHMFNDFSDKYEIIGNIHENPELLGEEED